MFLDSNSKKFNIQNINDIEKIKFKLKQLIMNLMKKKILKKHSK